jgi:ribonuclease P protein component
VKIISLNKNYEFQRLYRRGASAAGAYFVLYARRNGGNENRLGITVSKKVGGAVQRNRAKRRLKELYRTNSRLLKKGYDIVIVARASAVTVEYEALKRAYFWAIRKAGISNDKNN